jgi:2-polyprenyl-6-methoxyphenol hydroxylase-like FAD-dependent oxidoreductase
MPTDYDLAIVGGGLAGSSLGTALARTGARVLIIEREAQFRDRVRGEGMQPWGAAEARALGLHKPLIEDCAHETRWWTMPQENRDLIETTPSRLGSLNFYHPEMQQRLLNLAVQAGVGLRRPAQVIGVIPGDPPTIRLRENGSEQQITARLVVGADGRHSKMRGWGDFPVNQDPQCLTIAGILYTDLALPEDAVQFVLNPGVQRLSVIIPIGGQRFRAYVCFRHDSRAPLSGVKDQGAFLDLSIATGAAAEWFADARAIGPLASFDGADSWVEFPYREGVVLIGDAAAASDPSFGCGLSLTLRDVRVLKDHLLAEQDWSAAAWRYAEEHRRYYALLHRVHGWFRDLWFGAGAEADALRARALPRIAEDPTRIPDFLGCGPEAPSDDDARRRLFGED